MVIVAFHAPGSPVRDDCFQPATPVAGKMTRNAKSPIGTNDLPIAAVPGGTGRGMGDASRHWRGGLKAAVPDGTQNQAAIVKKRDFIPPILIDPAGVGFILDKSETHRIAENSRLVKIASALLRVSSLRDWAQIRIPQAWAKAKPFGAAIFREAAKAFQA